MQIEEGKIDEETLDKIRKIARKRGITESQVISEAIDKLAASLYFDEDPETGSSYTFTTDPFASATTLNKNLAQKEFKEYYTKKLKHGDGQQIVDWIKNLKSGDLDEIPKIKKIDLESGAYSLDLEIFNSLSNPKTAKGSWNLAMLFKDNLDEEAKQALPETHMDRTSMTRGLIHMMHNKIFPAIFLTYVLDNCLKEGGKTWVSLDSFKDLAYDVSVKFVNMLADGTPNLDLKEGFPATDDKLKRKLKRSWSKTRKEDELNHAREQSRIRFLNNFVGTYKEVKNLFGGVFGEWELADLKVEKDGREWITLGRNGREVIKKFKNLGKHDFSNEKFVFSNAQIGWFIVNILNSFPLEEKAARMMLKKAKFGVEDKTRGTSEFGEEFYKLQKPYLEKEEGLHEVNFILNIEEKLAKLKADERKLSNLPTKEWDVSRNRAIAAMARLKELGLFSSSSWVYEITNTGKKIFAEYLEADEKKMDRAKK